AQPYCVVFLTVHAAGSRSILCTDTCGPIIVECLKTGCEINGLDLIAYCLMPDHLHIVLMTEPGSELQKYLSGLKWATSRKLRAAGIADSIWQRSYWDRHHRDDEDVHHMIRYVMENPLRKGLCQQPEEWRFSEYFGLPQ
ncbi:MAG: REP-associated tyrosine transposase, partial [Bacteroidota bacterium]